MKTGQFEHPTPRLGLRNADRNDKNGAPSSRMRKNQITMHLQSKTTMPPTILADNPLLLTFALVGAELALITLATAAFISIRNHHRNELRHRRLTYGRCVHCGYNRRDSISSLCPECGK